MAVPRSSVVVVAFVFSILAGWPAAGSGRAELLGDLATGVERSGGGEIAWPLIPAGERVVFRRYSSQFEPELWSSDGTPVGTRAVGAFQGGARFLAPTERVALYYRSAWADGEGTSELWASDGTQHGTRRLLSVPASFVRCVEPTSAAFDSRRVVVSLPVASGGCKLWLTDGSAAGTVPLPSHASLDAVTKLARVGGRLLVFGRKSGGGAGLWSYGATLSGPPTLVVSLDSPPDRSTVLGGRVLFTAVTNGKTRLWTSDGTAPGTQVLLTIGLPWSFVHLETLGERAYFVFDDGVQGSELWQSDGTGAGTYRLTDLPPANPVGSHFARVGDQLLFFADDGTNGWRLWASDGTPAGAEPFLACGSGQCPLVAPFGTELVPLASNVAFVAHTDAHGLEVWATDGSAAGTKVLSSSCAGTCSRLVPSVQGVGGLGYFVTLTAAEPDLWQTDGTSGGTRRIGSLGVGSHLATNVNGEPLSALADGRAFLVMYDEGGTTLWSASAAGELRRLTIDAPFTQSSSPTSIVRWNEDLAFLAVDLPATAIYRTDGTRDGTREAVRSAEPGLGPSPLASLGGFELFREPERAALGGYLRLWRLDGDERVALSPAAHELSETMIVGDAIAMLTTRLEDAAVVLWWLGHPLASPVKVATWQNQQVGGLAAAAGRAYLLVRKFGTGHIDLWSSNGTPAGTAPVTAFASADAFAYGDQLALVELDGGAVFVTKGPSGVTEIWRSGGTLASTARFVPADARIEQHLDLWSRDGELWFLGVRGGASALYRFDPAAGAAIQLATLPTSGQSPGAVRFTERIDFEGMVLFRFEDRDHGAELWSSDGTSAGTRLLADLAPGDDSSAPESLVRLGGRVYFAATTEEAGRELWSTDGTEAGTRLEHDFAPGAASSWPSGLTADGDSLFLVANDGLVGHEPWVFRPDAACQASATALCLGGGRFEVKATWRDFQGRTGEGMAVPATSDTGMFWFFAESNIEVMIKLLDGRPVNDHRWVFYGALSSVEYAVTVTDLETGVARRYVNPPRALASVADTTAFGLLGAHLPGVSEVTSMALEAPDPHRIDRRQGVPSFPCSPSATRLCLLDSRFSVEATFKVPPGSPPAPAQVIQLPGGDTGVLWFFRPDNYEVIVKVRDGRPVNGKFWVFYGALSNVEYALTVTDTETGAVRTYTNPQGNLASVADTAAF